MVRLEIFANRSVEDELMGQLALIDCHYFTKIPIAYGEGNKEPKQGDAVWPEMNFIMILYCEEDYVEKVCTAIRAVKRRFEAEGIQLFKVSSAEILE